MDSVEGIQIPALDILTINGESEGREGLLDMVWRACERFPRGVWGGVRYLGDLRVGFDVRMLFRGRVHGAFVFHRLMGRMREFKRSRGTPDPLLGVTPSPVITVHYRLEGGRLERTVSLVHDYVSERVGVVSLFTVDEEFSDKIMAHGLGHNRGLEHHGDPVDLMYTGLLRHPSAELDRFCSECIRKLEKRARR